MKGQLRWLFGTRSAGGFYRARDYYSGINGCLHGYMIRNRERKGLESAFAMYGDCPAAAREHAYILLTVRVSITSLNALRWHLYSIICDAERLCGSHFQFKPIRHTGVRTRALQKNG